jgi:hypothetical protein
MAGPIYKMFRIRTKDAWYQLSEAEQNAFFEKLDEAMEKVGGKTILTCNSRWHSEEWSLWGVEEFPSLEAVQDLARLLGEMKWFRYCESESILGTAIPET